MPYLLVPVLTALLALPVLANDARSYDVLELPAVESPLASSSLVYSVTRAGERIVATGIRGHILLSDDEGDSWRQARSVPVRSSLLSASFTSPRIGWVVGHEGVVLRTEDGGETWTKQLDGIELAEIGLEYYQRKAAAEPDNDVYAFLVDEMRLAREQGADKPFFTVHMRNPDTGIVGGAYGLLFRTEDAGESWYPVMELLDLYQLPHIFDYVQVDSDATVELSAGEAPADLMASGEMGTILAYDPESGLWQAQDFPYEGSMFTIVQSASGTLVTGGLRGLAFRSADLGQSWEPVRKPPTGAVVASTLLRDGRLILATAEGGLLESRDDGATFTPIPVPSPQPLSDVLEGRPGELILTGFFGLRVFPLPRQQ